MRDKAFKETLQLYKHLEEKRRQPVDKTFRTRNVSQPLMQTQSHFPGQKNLSGSGKKVILWHVAASHETSKRSLSFSVMTSLTNRSISFDWSVCHSLSWSVICCEAPLSFEAVIVCLSASCAVALVGELISCFIEKVFSCVLHFLPLWLSPPHWWGAPPWLVSPVASSSV